jgi:hypothetical protein
MAQQNGTFKKVTILDSFKLRGVAISHIAVDFSTLTHFHLPTVQAVYDLVMDSAIDTIYIVPGAGGDPDTICITGPLCAVLPPGLSAIEVASQISDSLDWVRATGGYYQYSGRRRGDRSNTNRRRGRQRRGGTDNILFRCQHRNR